MSVEHHFYEDGEIQALNCLLLEWYEKNRRPLPWRQLGSHLNLQDQAYRVLVSEIMLQQTKVCTVIKYYNCWVKKWPTLRALAKADIDQVQRQWKGLGYYSRASRLLSLAKKYPTLPCSSLELLKMPGIGVYTAGAVASIVFGEAVPAVDGNVIRVLCRLRAISAEVSTSKVKKHISDLASSLVPRENPSSWNQAFMELGAIVCTPRNPKCDQCPIQRHCRAYSGKVHDIEDCVMCDENGKGKNCIPSNFPKKRVKRVSRKEVRIVCIISKKDKCFVVKRNSIGLLADLWQFPTFITKRSNSASMLTHVGNLLKQHLNLRKSIIKKSFVGEVFHRFSHIDMTYKVIKVNVCISENLSIPSDCCEMAWVTTNEFQNLAASTAMAKVFGIFLGQ